MTPIEQAAGAGVGVQRLPLESGGEALRSPDGLTAEAAAEGFTGAMQSALDATNAQVVAADDMVDAFVEGADIPVHQVMVALTKADLQMRLTTAITTKAIAAYQEIARLQV